MKIWVLFLSGIVICFIGCGQRRVGGGGRDGMESSDRRLTCLFDVGDSVIYYTGSSSKMLDINRGKVDDSGFVKAMFGKIKDGGLSLTLKPGDGAGVMGNLEEMANLAKSYGITNPTVDSTDANEEKTLGIVTAPPLREYMQGHPTFKLYLPKDDADSPEAISKLPKESQLVILISGGQDIYAYMGGDMRNGKKYTYREITDFVKGKRADKNFFVLIKPTKNSTYKNTVDILDVMTTAGIKHYALVDITKQEEDYLLEIDR